MKNVFNYSRLLVVVLCLLTGGVAQAQKKKVLFNGKNLDGWYSWLKTTGKNNDPKGVFTVSKGQIVISGEEYGCITTNEEYENYKLTVDYKWGERTFPPRVDRAKDNGILIHSQGADGAYSGVWMYSIEVQLIEGGTGDFLVVADGSKNFELSSPVAPEKQGASHIYQPGGQLATINKGRINWLHRDPEWKDVIGFRGAKDAEKAVGKWNRLEIFAKGDAIDVYLNGILVNQAVNVKPSKGRIQIQSEGAEMFVRKVELLPL
jgi:hypothetical protein